MGLGQWHSGMFSETRSSLIEKPYFGKSSVEVSLMGTTRGSNDDVVVTEGDKNKRTILRQRIAIQGLALLCLCFSMLFVWQLTTNVMNAKKSNKSPAATVNSDGLLELEARRCPMVPSQHLLPRTLPSTVNNALYLDDLVFKSLTELPSLEGLVASIIYQDKVIWTKKHGMRDSKASSPVPPDQNTVFRVASVSKILTVIFVFFLLESGSISSLDDPLDKYEPNFVVINKFNWNKITIRHILTHTSGLPREVPCGESWSKSKRNLCPVNTTYVLEKLKTTELKSPPGKEPNYSNLAFALLSRILAQRFASGNYENWVRSNVLLPLRMTNSGFDLKSMPSNKAVSYGSVGLNADVDWGWAAPAFQLYSSTADLSKLMMALFQVTPFRIVKPEMLIQILTPNFVYPDGLTMVGLGWEMKLTGSFVLVSKAGSIPGYSAGFAFYPQLRLGAIVLMTGREVAPAAVELLLKPIAQRFAAYMIKQIKINVPSNTNKYLGSYELVSKWIEKVRFNVTLEEGVLQLHENPGFPSVSYLNFIQDNILELVYKPGFSCNVYGMGQNHERLHFQKPTLDGKCPGFKFGPFVFVRTKGNSIPSQGGVLGASKIILSKLV